MFDCKDDYTVFDIWKEKIQSHYVASRRLIPTIQHDFYTRLYDGNALNIDKVLVRKYGSRRFQSLLAENMDDVIEEWNDTISAYANSMSEMYDRILETALQEYDPLSNYDKVSHIVETHLGDVLKKSGTETTATTKDGTETTATTKDGTETTATTKDGTETTATTKDGTETTKTDRNEKDLNKRTTVDPTPVVELYEKKYVAPENDEDTYLTEETVHTEINTNTWEETVQHVKNDNAKDYYSKEDLSFTDRTDEAVTSFNNRKDEAVTSFNNRTDEAVTSFNNRKDEAVTSFDNRKDSVDFNITTDETTKGNIGTTRNTEMLTEEIIARINLNIITIIFGDIIKANTY